MKLNPIIPLVVISTIFFAKLTKAQNADCNTLLLLTDTIYHAKNISGFGDKMEFEDNFNDNFSSFPQETNSIWYLFQTPNSGNFTFDILSNNELDDWDFLLFEYKTQFCKRIDSNKIKPIRANLSRSSNTGLSLYSTNEFSLPGINNNYSKYVTAKGGEEFVLVVNNSKRAKGSHTLLLHYPASENIEKSTTDNPKDEIKETHYLIFSFEIKDGATNQLIPAKVSVNGLMKDVFELIDITNYEANVERTAYKINLMVSTKGFMLYSTKVIINKNQDKYHQTISLERIAEGKKVNLDNIQFEAASAKFLKPAVSPLKSLLHFMTLNPNVSIEIEGHVNGPGQSNTQEFKKLSFNRAFAVKKFLTDNGIDNNRIQQHGYGNSKMIFPNPKNEDEHSANRRVEIKIISK